MKIFWHTPQTINGRYPDPVWPEGWPLPPVGSDVYVGEGDVLKVRAIDFYPQGSEGDTEPFVYVVLAELR